MSRTHSTSTGISRHGPLSAETLPTGLLTLGKTSGGQCDLESPCRACYLQEIPGDTPSRFPAGRKGQQDIYTPPTYQHQGKVTGHVIWEFSSFRTENWKLKEGHCYTCVMFSESGTDIPAAMKNYHFVWFQMYHL